MSQVIVTVTTTLLEATTKTSTNTLEFVVSETRAWWRSAHQEIYRSTLTKVAQETPTCSKVVAARNTIHITSTVDMVISSTTTTTTYILEDFTTTLRGEGANRCVNM